MSNPACLSWYVMLKITKLELELIPDPHIYLFFEKGTRAYTYIFRREQFMWLCNVYISSNKWIQTDRS